MSPAKKDEAIVLDIRPFLMPIAIVLSSLIFGVSMMISAAILSNNFSGVSASASNGGSAVAGDNTADFPPVDDTLPTQDTNATTSIDDDPVMGNRDTAKVAIVEFSDYECPFCKRHHTETLPDIINNYVNTGEAILVYRDFPLSFHDPLATTQAIAAECVQELAGDEAYFEFGETIFKTTNSNGNGMEKSELYDIAANMGIDRGRFTECLDSEKYKEEVSKDISDGAAAGITGTPGFVIGLIDSEGNVDGVNVSGAQPYSVFEKVIEEHLAR